MRNTVVVGAQWGDEGKAKITDLLAEKADMVIRYQGGCNAGHTVVYNGETYKLHLVPSGILYGNKICFIVAGTVVLPENFEQEVKELISTQMNRNSLILNATNNMIYQYLESLNSTFNGSAGSIINGNNLIVTACSYDSNDHFATQILSYILENLTGEIFSESLDKGRIVRVDNKSILDFNCVEYKLTIPLTD